LTSARLVSARLKLQVSDAFTLRLDCETRAPLLGLYGPSGAGKSLTVALICGLARPTTGRLAVGSFVLADTEARVFVPPEVRRIGLLGQDPLLFPHLTVAENLTFGRPRRGARQDPDEVAMALQLTALLGRRPRNLSGGERQRVALGRALLSDPRLLVLDEPFSALDDRLRLALLALLARAHRQFGVPMILVSHRAEDLLALVDEVLVLEGGVVVAHGPPEDVLAPGAPYGGEANLLRGVVLGRLADGEYAVRVGEEEWHVAGASDLAAGQRVRMTLRARDIAVMLAAAPGASARNRIRARVLAAKAWREGVHILELSTPSGRLRAAVTPEAATDLDLRPGRDVVAIVKASALEVLARA
jgi:molybdate transport system ATP-binding protein